MLLSVAPTYVLEDGPVRVVTDIRWFAARPAGGASGPIVELRRWPGDTVLALYAVVGPTAAPPPVPGVRWDPAATSGAGAREWSGTLSDGTGERPVAWAVREAEGADRHLAAFMLPGDAGLGVDALPDRLAELRAVWRRVELEPARWSRLPAPAAGVAPALPSAGIAPASRAEDDDPWQVVEGGGFSLSVPPGVAIRLTSAGIAPPVPVPGQLAWFRGRFVDVEDRPVVLGDGRRAGYLAAVREDAAAWFASDAPPLGAPDATRDAAQPFDVAAERTGAREARAERWSEPGFAGEWVVVRLLFGEIALEFGLPVVEGGRSPSLYWIPLTWRGPGRAPAPPPRDPMERFGITFSRLRPIERERDPWTEGVLEAPGLVVKLPLGWLPAASLRTGDGYPISIVAEDGRTLGVLRRLAPADVPGPGDPWEEHRRLGGRRGAATRVRDDGAVLILAREGHAFQLEPGPAAAEGDAWERLLDALQITKSP